MSGRFTFVLKRIVLSVPLFLGVVFMVFLLLQVTPGDPARVVAGLRASPEQVAEVREEMGLERPVLAQYVDYVGDVARGDLGYSYKSRQPVATVIGSRLPVSGWLLAFGIGFSLLIAVPLGTWSALRRDRVDDHVIRGMSLLGIAMPSFWVGLMLILLVALPTGWFPVGGFGQGIGGHVRSMILPGLTLGFVMAPLQIRSLRSSVIRVLGSDYVTTGRALGARGLTLMRRFVLRNAVSSMVTILAIEISFVLFALVVVEATFALPGIGEGMVLAATQRDFPAVQGYTLVFAVAVVVVYLLADIVNSLLDPRVEVTS